MKRNSSKESSFKKTKNEENIESLSEKSSLSHAEISALQRNFNKFQNRDSSQEKSAQKGIRKQGNINSNLKKGIVKKESKTSEGTSHINSFSSQASNVFVWSIETL
jgi:hypothetical protein